MINDTIGIVSHDPTLAHLCRRGGTKGTFLIVAAGPSGPCLGQHLFVRLENGTMVISPSIIASAKRWGDDNMAGQIVPAGGRAMRAAEVVDLLANRTSPRAQPGARKLLNDMATGPWRVVSPIHTSGDGTPHLTVELNRDRYHLRMDAQGCVFDITATIAGQR